MKSKLKQKIPAIFMFLLSSISVYLGMKSIFNYFFLMIGQFLGLIPSFILFGDSTNPSLLGFLIAVLFLIPSWLISTKFKRFQTVIWRNIWFWNMFLGIFFHYLWLISAPVYNTFVPYLGDRLNQMDDVSIWQAIAIGNTNNLLIIVMFIPTIVTSMLMIWLAGQYSQHSEDLKEAFYTFEFSNRRLQKFFKLEDKSHWPDITLGPDSKTGELVVQPGRDRTLNNIIIGSIGTGKTAALVLPIINQDLHWMTRFINDYPKIYNRDDFETEEGKGMYLNGISVIEPSNDLCQKAFQLVKAHGIPEESVFYIDPTNPNTPNINPMQGPTEKVAEAFAMVIEGLAEGGKSSNFFFQQSERNHLKHYIYLLKLHEPNQEVTFDMLLNMYNNSQMVRLMHVKLKATFPANYDLIENRDERNHWMIVKQIDEWFDQNLLPKKVRAGGGEVTEKITHGEYRGQDAYYDAKAEYVQGLRNILNDIGASPLIRRVLFGKSKFSWDEHLNSGGVLLVNTAKGEMGGLSNILGKLILLSLQNAVFRRKPNVSTFHHIIVDEFPDYVYQPFKEFPAQSRKYKAIVTVVAQTVTQLADKYGETYMHTLLGTLRHKMVYGDIPDFDAQLFSKMFGEEERYEESTNEQAVSPLQEKPMLRIGNTYTKTKEAILSPSDIIYQKAFQCAAKLVVNNEPIPVRQLDANFVPKDEFKEAVTTVNEEQAAVWLKHRLGNVGEQVLIEEGIQEQWVDEEHPARMMDELESTPIVTYPGPDQPIHFQYTEPSKCDEPISTTEKKEIKPPVVYREGMPKSPPTVIEVFRTPLITNPVVEDVLKEMEDEEELETLDWGNFIKIPITKEAEEDLSDSPKPLKPDLDEKPLELLDELTKTLNDKPIKNEKDAVKALFSEFDED
jgi:hypothetical protein